MPLTIKRPPKFAARAPRKGVRAISSVLLPDHGEVQVLVMNLSPEGFMAIVESPVAPGTRVGMSIPGIGIIRATVRWADENEIGGQFETPLSGQLLDCL